MKLKQKLFILRMGCKKTGPVLLRAEEFIAVVFREGWGRRALKC
jgi:hypothetical protein